MTTKSDATAPPRWNATKPLSNGTTKKAAKEVLDAAFQLFRKSPSSESSEVLRLAMTAHHEAERTFEGDDHRPAASHVVLAREMFRRMLVTRGEAES